MTRLLPFVFSFTVLGAPMVTHADEALTFAVRVVASAGVAGHFADPVCEGGVSLRAAGFSRYASSLYAPAPSGDEAFVVDTGGLAQPHGVARHALAEAPDTLASLIVGLGYDALAFGYRDLEGDRERTLSAARALEAHGVPYVVSNLRCDPAARALCDLVKDEGDDPLIFGRGADRVAFLAYLDPSAMRRVTAGNRRGLTFTPVEAAVRAGVLRARALGATIVVVSVDNGASATAITEALTLAEALAGDAKPDLLLAARAGEDMLFTRPASFTPAIASAPPAAVSIIDIRRNVATSAFDMIVSRPRGEEGSTPPIDAFIGEVGPSYCVAYGARLEGGHLERPFDANELFALATASVREAAHAEIAVLNRGAVEDTFSPMRTTSLTRSDVHVGLRYDERIVAATVSAEYLKLLARALVHNTDVVMLGLTIVNPGAADEAITINGRPLDPRGRYRLATVRFIADGGDGLFPTGTDFAELPITLRGALFEHLERPRTSDPRDDFTNPADRLVFAFTMQSDASFGGSAIENDPAFDASQLARENNIVFGTQNTLSLSAQSTRYAWDNTLVARYRSTRVSDGTREEGDDVISFRTNARYRGFRARVPKVYVPEPFAEVYWESEFTLPDAATRTYRHFLLRPTLGLQFTLTPQLGLRLNGGFDLEALAPDAKPLPGVGGQLLLTPWTFFTTGRRSGTISGSIDYFASDLGRGRSDRQELRAALDFGVVLSSYFGLAVTSTLYGLRERGSEIAFAFSTTASVRVGWYVRTQR